jgi:hypothetical protein
VAFGLGPSQVLFTLVYVIVRSVLGLLVVLSTVICPKTLSCWFCVYRSKIGRVSSELRIRDVGYATLRYSLITPPSIFWRSTGASAGPANGVSWSGGRCWRDWCGR